MKSNLQVQFETKLEKTDPIKREDSLNEWLQWYETNPESESYNEGTALIKVELARINNKKVPKNKKAAKTAITKTCDYLADDAYQWHTDRKTGEVFINQNKLAELCGYDKGNLSRDISQGVVNITGKMTQILTVGGIQGAVIYSQNDFITVLMHQVKKSNQIAQANIAMIVGHTFTELGHNLTGYNKAVTKPSTLDTAKIKVEQVTRTKQATDTIRDTGGQGYHYMQFHQILNEAQGIASISEIIDDPAKLIDRAVMSVNIDTAIKNNPKAKKFDLYRTVATQVTGYRFAPTKAHLRLVEKKHKQLGA